MSVVKRCLVAVLGAGVLAVGAGAGTASAEPLAPNCTAGDLAQVMTGVSAGMSVYLFTHPQVNEFFTGLQGLSAADKRQAVIDYMAANPQVHDEIIGVRQPGIDFRNRCGLAPMAPME